MNSHYENNTHLGVENPRMLCYYCFRVPNISLTTFGASQNMNGHAYNIQFENKEEESLHEIQQYMTKQMLGLMLAIGDGELSNKQLAHIAGKSPSATSNLLDRMKKCPTPLLNISRRDKHVMYSLSPIALKYIEQYARTEESKDQKVIHLHSAAQECLLALKKLLENIEENFAVWFTGRLILYVKGQKEEDQKDFYDFMECLEGLIIKDYIKELKDVLEEPELRPLKEEIWKYFAKVIHIRGLCQMDSCDWKMAYGLVDSFFDLKCQSIGMDILKKCEGRIDVSEIIGITDSLKEMSVRRESMSKETFIESWNRYFSGHEQLLYYIAEKIVNMYR